MPLIINCSHLDILFFSTTNFHVLVHTCVPHTQLPGTFSRTSCADLKDGTHTTQNFPNWQLLISVTTNRKAVWLKAHPWPLGTKLEHFYSWACWKSGDCSDLWNPWTAQAGDCRGRWKSKDCSDLWNRQGHHHRGITRGEFWGGRTAGDWRIKQEAFCWGGFRKICSLKWTRWACFCNVSREPSEPYDFDRKALMHADGRFT